MVKVIDPPWYKPVVSKVVASTSISKMDELQRQEAQVSVPTPRDDKSTKVFSSTRVQKTTVCTGPEYRRDDAFLGVLLLHQGLGQPDDEAVTVVDVLCNLHLIQLEILKISSVNPKYLFPNLSRFSLPTSLRFMFIVLIFLHLLTDDLVPVVYVPPDEGLPAHRVHGPLHHDQRWSGMFQLKVRVSNSHLWSSSRVPDMWSPVLERKFSYPHSNVVIFTGKITVSLFITMPWLLQPWSFPAWWASSCPTAGSPPPPACMWRGWGPSSSTIYLSIYLYFKHLCNNTAVSTMVVKH